MTPRFDHEKTAQNFIASRLGRCNHPKDQVTAHTASLLFTNDLGKSAIELHFGARIGDKTVSIWHRYFG
jgi:hypothetical protein